MFETKNPVLIHRRITRSIKEAHELTEIEPNRIKFVDTKKMVRRKECEKSETTIDIR